ncbi:MAG: DUF2334 domain-containing protein [bacterium]|nr:DUF2334 domain-containing protein [bacterium]
MIRYFFRLDDITPNMNWDNFNFLVSIFKKHNIKPLLAVIPDNKDSKLLGYPADPNFWGIMNGLRQNSWVIGQHGYQHLSKGGGGILGVHNSGEFGGLDFKFQESMITSGKEIIKTNLVNPEIFIAPRHSFDKNTVEALKINGFNYISDGIALYPFKKWGIIWLPQILWRPRKGLFGMITVALHPNTMTDKDFNDLEEFMGKNIKKIGNFSELMYWYSRQNIIKKFLVFLINQPFKIFWYLAFRIKHGLSR